MNALLASLRREVARLRRDRTDRAMLTWVPLLALVLIWWIFSAGLPRQLPVGVLDEDHSALSRQLVRMLQASPGLRVAQAYPDAQAAEAGLRTTEVYAVVRVPRDFARDVKQGHVGQVTLLHNAQLSTHSSLIQRDVRAVVGTLSAGVEMAARNKRGEAARAVRTSMTPIQANLVSLFNVSGNYEQFLAVALMPALLHVLAMTAGAWTVGREMRDRTLGEWLGRPTWRQALAAVTGKLAPAWLTLTAVAWLALAGMTVASGWQPPGSIAWVALGEALLLSVSLAAGALLAAATRSLRTGLSGAGFFAAPAFAFSGVGFPLAAMSPTARAWAEAMPFTHFVRLQTEQLVMGAPWRLSVATPLALLAATLVLLAASAWALRRAAGQSDTWGGR